MHAVVLDSLEEYLSGLLEPAAQREVEAHLNLCQKCREELGSMRDVAQLFVSLRSEETWDPSPGFFAGVVQRLSERKVPSFAGFFALNLAFGRRLAFASLLTLAVLGGYLVTRETQYAVGPSPEAIIAEQNSPAFDTARAEDNMLLTLTAYEQR